MFLFTEKDLPNPQLNAHLMDVSIIAELKIGISTGQFLCYIASHCPHRFFVGIEFKPHTSIRAAKRILRKSLDNVIVINMEATRYITENVEDSTFEAIHIYFPTPYPRAIG